MIAARFTTITVLLNLIALPLYFIPVLNVFVFGALNGYLLGREYFELTIHRRIKPSQTKEFYKKLRRKIILTGGITSFLMTIPLINMVAPIIATAAMVHLIQKSNTNFSPTNT